MASIACGSILLVVSLFAMATAYYPMHRNHQQSCYRPQYETPSREPSCRESIEDLKALIDLSNALKKENNNCQTCNKTFSEEVIIKLIDALVTTATHNCYKHEDSNEGKNGTVGNTGVEEGKEVTTESGHDHGHSHGKDVITRDNLRDALIKLGVLNGNNNNDNVDVDIRNTEGISVHVDNEQGKAIPN